MATDFARLRPAPDQHPVPAVARTAEPTGAAAAGQVVALLPQPAPGRTKGAYVRIVKPAADRVVSLVALAIAALPMAVIALIVAASMGRPVLFRQRRVGRGGQEFDVLKFRTMRPDRRAVSLDVIHDRRVTHKSDRDPRHTRIGRVLRRYSLDELPQLFNVLRGDMSIVGPRPELESVVATYPVGLERRHVVKPGLTGLWQINARGDGPMHEHGEWDLAYVERVSLRTDLEIILRTPKAMLGDNAGS